MSSWLATPWRIFRLKRRVIAQRGTIIAQRDEIRRLRAAVEVMRRGERCDDALSVRRERNKMAATGVASANLAALQGEDELSKLRREVEQWITWRAI